MGNHIYLVEFLAKEITEDTQIIEKVSGQELLNENFNPVTTTSYEFVCHLFILHPSLEIIKNKTNIPISEMIFNSVSHDGIDFYQAQIDYKSLLEIKGLCCLDYEFFVDEYEVEKALHNLKNREQHSNKVKAKFR